MYGINYAPELTGIGKYTGEMVEWLVQRGDEVVVVTAPPYYPGWQVHRGYSAKCYKLDSEYGEKIIRCPLWVPAQPSGVKRILHLASFAITSLPIVLWFALVWRPKVIFLVEPPFFCAAGALLAGLISRASTWLHVQDFELDAAFDLGIVKSQSVKKIVFYFESVLLQRFDCVSTISEKMCSKLKDKGVPGSRVKLFENWVDADKIYPLDDVSDMKRALVLPQNSKIVLYSGNMGQKQGLDILIAAARILEYRDDILFVLCGEGSYREKLMELSAGMVNVRFIPLQPIEKLNELLNIASVHVLPQQAGIEDLVMPSKLTNMMASGKPVVATVSKDTQIAAVLENRGVCVQPGDVDALCGAIVRLVDNAFLADELAKKARDYVEAHWGKNELLSRVFDCSDVSTAL